MKIAAITLAAALCLTAIGPARSASPAHGIIFEGNSSFPAKRLLRELERYAVRIHPPLRKTDADDAAFFVAEFYRCEGFRDVQVHARWKGEGEAVVLQISEGDAKLLGNIRFRGNMYFSEDHLGELVRASLRLSTRSITGRLRLVDSALQKAAERLHELYYNSGSHQAVVNLEQVQGEKQNLCDVTFVIHEGAQFRIGKIVVKGMPFGNDALARRLWELLEAERGAVWTTERGLLLRGSLLRVLRESSYFGATAEVDSLESGASGLVDIHVRLTTGSPYKLGHISVDGASRTLKTAILAQLGVKEGQMYNARLLREGEHRLWFSGAFSEIQVIPKIRDDHHLDLRVVVQEGRPKQLRGTVGYSQLEQLFIQANYTDRNFLGTLRRLSLDANYSLLRYGVLLQLSDPWLFNSETSGLVAAFYQYNRFPAYRADFVGGSVGLQRQFQEPNLTGYVLRYIWRSVFNTEVYGLAQSELSGGQNYILGAVQWGQTLDRRNDVLSPMSGYLLKYEIEGASNWLAGDLNYFKVSVQGTKYVP